MLFFWTFIHQRILKKKKSIMVSTKILSSTTVYMDNNNNKKDHVTLQTGCWKFSFAITEINYILMYIKTEKCYFKLQ